MFPVEVVWAIIVVSITLAVVGYLAWDYYTGPDYSEFDGWMDDK